MCCVRRGIGCLCGFRGLGEVESKELILCFRETFGRAEVVFCAEAVVCVGESVELGSSVRCQGVGFGPCNVLKYGMSRERVLLLI